LAGGTFSLSDIFLLAILLDWLVEQVEAEDEFVVDFLDFLLSVDETV
jgi:hypothetical protein